MNHYERIINLILEYTRSSDQEQNIELKRKIYQTPTSDLDPNTPKKKAKHYNRIINNPKSTEDDVKAAKAALEKFKTAPLAGKELERRPKQAFGLARGQDVIKSKLAAIARSKAKLVNTPEKKSFLMGKNVAAYESPKDFQARYQENLRRSMEHKKEVARQQEKLKKGAEFIKQRREFLSGGKP